MHLNNFFLRSFRVLLFPFAAVYGLVLKVRNILYNRDILKSVHFNLPVICVGNLSVGGTGKSPMVDMLAGMLKQEYKVATLSRGYKRRSKGYLLAGPDTTAVEIGDEPMQFHLRHPDIAVAVGEERIVAVPQLLYDRPETQVIILDDAFQHRAIRAGFNILLTPFDDLYTRDFYLPTGDLRDNISSAARADIIVVTKCDPALDARTAEAVRIELNPHPGQQLFFTAIRYGRLYHIIHQSPRDMHPNMDVLLICGIANPRPLTNFIEESTNGYEAMFFSDHHIFSVDDLNEIRKRFEDMQGTDKLIITTEKDAVRLVKYRQELRDLPFYVLPISVQFLFEREQDFRGLITNFIGNYGK